MFSSQFQVIITNKNLQTKSLKICLTHTQLHTHTKTKDSICSDWLASSDKNDSKGRSKMTYPWPYFLYFTFWTHTTWGVCLKECKRVCGASLLWQVFLRKKHICDLCDVSNTTNSAGQLCKYPISIMGAFLEKQIPHRHTPTSMMCFSLSEKKNQQAA